MKIIHTGDVHIGSALNALPKDKAAIRRAEIVDGFRRLLSYAKEEKVQAVLIAGDLFDTDTVSPNTKNEICAAIENAAPVNVFYASGNHDGDFAFETPPKNFYTFSDRAGWKSYSLGEGVTLTGADAKYFSAAFSAVPVFDAHAFNICMLHGDAAREIPLPALQRKNIDYLALGHIHIPDVESKRLDGRGKYRYCGCLEGRGFDEVGARGFFLLEIEKGAIKNERFLSFAKRNVLSVRADLSGCNTFADVERVALDALAKTGGENMVKLVLCGRYAPQLKKDIPLLFSRLCERFFFLKIEDESRLAIDFNDYKNDLTERGEFVRQAGRYEMNEKLREEVLEVGLKALMGEEIDL